MSVQVKRRRESAAFLSSFVGAQGELLVDTTNNRIQVHDGATPGGWPVARLADLPQSSSPLAVTSGGTGASTAAGARAVLGAAATGANADITSLSALTTALSVAQGGTGTTTATGTGANVLASAPTLTAPNLGTPSAINLANATNVPAVALAGTVALAQGGTGGTTAAAARATLGAAASGANADIVSLGTLASINGGPLAGLRNRLRNGNFAINQRGVSGTVTLAAGAYGHDGVKGGASGATYTFGASGIDTVLTITAGSLILPIEAGLIEGGTYTVSQAGTAQARVWQGTGSSGSGAYATVPAAGLTIPGLSAATQTNVEFSTGTLLRAQVEQGGVATPFERRSLAVELVLCQRYYFATPVTGVIIRVYNTGASSSNMCLNYSLPVPMRVTPTVVVTVDISDASPISPSIVVATTNRDIIIINSIPSNSNFDLDSLTASAEL